MYLKMQNTVQKWGRRLETLQTFWGRGGGLEQARNSEQKQTTRQQQTTKQAQTTKQKQITKQKQTTRQAQTTKQDRIVMRLADLDVLT